MLHSSNKKSLAARYGQYFLFACIVFQGTSLLAQSSKHYPLVRTPLNVTINKKIPKSSLATGEVMPAKFSKNPTDEEIFQVHFFEEALVPALGNGSTEENIALVNALAAYSQRTSPDDFTAITNFLNTYSSSRWKGALLANMGIVYRRSGYYNQAMMAWEQSWNILKDQTIRRPKLLADKVIGELLLINAWVGRADKMEALIKQIDRRNIEGPAGERVAMVRRAIWQMRNKPEISFMCGPYALNKISALRDSTKPFNQKLMAARSTSKGFSLVEVERLSKEAGLEYQMAFRNAGAEVIPKAVVHWKLDHYSALVKKSNGYYMCEDATMGTVYGQQFWLSAAALDSSASGYFLVPKGALPAGWRMVTAEEGGKVFGKGVEPPDPGKHVTPGDPQKPDCGGSKPMAQANVHLSAASLHVFDRPVYYTPPVGPPMFWDMDYHQRDSYQPANFSYSNMGPKWTFNWLSYVQDDPNNPSVNADIYVMGGGARTFVSFDVATQSYAPEIQTSDVLVRICPSCYELRHEDGSKEIYARPDGNTAAGRKVFLTQHVDAHGNAMSVMYDANLRITALKDAINQVTTFTYGNPDIYKITKITDPFGRFATFQYDALGRLISITDMIGIVSTFQYDAVDFINKMTTPYGSTTFAKEDGPANNRAIETTYPLGEKERVEFAENAEGVSFSEPVVPAGINVFNAYLTYRNTFYWDRKAMKEAPRKYAAAQLYHWLHGSGATAEGGTVAPMIESTKKPLENRVWHYYQGETSAGFANQGMSSQASITARVMDDGSTQMTRKYFNSIGHDTASIDPVGRKTTYVYDSNRIDLLEVRHFNINNSELLAKFTYNAQHLPLTSTDPSGLVTTFTYNAAGQMLTVKNPKNEVSIYTYDANGYLQSRTGPLAGSTINFGYDGFGRLRTVTDPEGYKVITDYDALDRPTVITYPDSSYQQMVYNRLDAVHMKDRMGRWSHTTYDSLERPTIQQDALGRITQFIWCSCGSLAEIIDPLKQVTSFTLDLQGRMTAKTYPDGKTVAYKYENTTSRLKEMTDAKGQKTQYTYYIDDKVKQIDYANAGVATPSVSYTYDSVYSRMTKMTDGTGATKYTYNPVSSGLGSWRLSSVDGPLANDVISFSYDSLTRVNNQSIDGVASTTAYDAMGRVSAQTNALGGFAYSYINQTKRFSSISFPNGQSINFNYFDNHGDQLLKEIWNKTAANTTLSKFNYEYNKERQITKWTQQAGTATPSFYTLGYDLADELISATQKNQSTSAIIRRYAYQYDKAGNRTTEQIDNSVTTSVFNNLNQLMSQQNKGAMRFKGSVNEFSEVQVKNITTADSVKAPVDSTNSFEAFVRSTPGVNNIAVTAKDYSGNNNKTVNSYNIAVTAGTNNNLTYDNNGNPFFSAVPGSLYEWDAVNRLVKITSSEGVTEFIYDGLSRLVGEKFNGALLRRWLWVGTQLCEERNASGGTVTKRFFLQGEQIGSARYFFSVDHIGSIREMTDINGAVQARYDYDPYGRKTKIAGSQEADFGFSGLYFNTTNNLNFALWRIYNPGTGRWLNRDPMDYAEFLPEGPNIYSYVGNNPVNWTDRLGLYTKGTPAAIDPNSNSVVCKGGKLTIQNNKTGIDKECTQAHEQNHYDDWVGRYGPNLCDGVPDGQLPLGGPGYDAFLKKSECNSYKIGKKCREEKLKNCKLSDDEKKTLEQEIARDDREIPKVCD